MKQRCMEIMFPIQSQTTKGQHLESDHSQRVVLESQIPLLGALSLNIIHVMLKMHHRTFDTASISCLMYCCGINKLIPLSSSVQWWFCTACELERERNRQTSKELKRAIQPLEFDFRQ